MISAAPVVQRLNPENLDEVVDVFADAFAEHPVMRFSVGADGDVAARERQLVRLFVTRRAARSRSRRGYVGNVRASRLKSLRRSG